MRELIPELLREHEVTAIDDPSKLPSFARFDVLVTNCDIFDAGIPTLFISVTPDRCKQAASHGIAVLAKPFTAAELHGALMKLPERHA